MRYRNAETVGAWLAGAPPDDLALVEARLREEAEQRRYLRRTLRITEATAYELQHAS